MQGRPLAPMVAFLAIAFTACGTGEVQKVVKPKDPPPAQALTGTWQSTGDEDSVVVRRNVPELLLASCKEREQSLTEAERKQCSELAKSQPGP